MLEAGWNWTHLNQGRQKPHDLGRDEIDPLVDLRVVEAAKDKEIGVPQKSRALRGASVVSVHVGPAFSPARSLQVTPIAATGLSSAPVS